MGVNTMRSHGGRFHLFTLAAIIVFLHSADRNHEYSTFAVAARIETLESVDMFSCRKDYSW